MSKDSIKNKSMNLLELIKRSGVIRKFRKDDIPDSIISQVLSAGEWGLSVLGIQPWEFVCIKDKKTISQISRLVSEKSEEEAGSVSIVLRITHRALETTNVLIAIYNNEKLQGRAVKYGKKYVNRAHMAELQSIGGAIQNMFLVANALGLGALWLDAPTFYEEEINEMLGVGKKSLIAFLALGYPDITPMRSKRKKEIVYK